MDSEAALMVEMYASGRSIRAIAKEVHWGPSAVRDRLLEAGVRLRRRGGSKPRLPHREFERTVFLYRQGLTMQQVGDELGVSLSTVHERLREAGEPPASGRMPTPSIRSGVTGSTPGPGPGGRGSNPCCGVVRP